MPIVTASPQPSVMLVYPPCTISPGTPVPNSTTMATTPLPKRINTSVPRNSAISSGSIGTWILSLRNKRRPQPLPGHIKLFRKHARLAHRSHEVGVAMPPRKDVHVDMPRDTRPGALPDVHPQVQSIGSVRVAQ